MYSLHLARSYIPNSQLEKKSVYCKIINNRSYQNHEKGGEI